MPTDDDPGERRAGEVLVTVDGAPLDWRSSLAVRNHAPTGPPWGYGGSGPAQLVLAILLAVTDAATAEQFYQQFTRVAPVGDSPVEMARAVGASRARAWREGSDDAGRRREADCPATTEPPSRR